MTWRTQPYSLAISWNHHSPCARSHGLELKNGAWGWLVREDRTCIYIPHSSYSKDHEHLALRLEVYTATQTMFPTIDYHTQITPSNHVQCLRVGHTKPNFLSTYVCTYTLRLHVMFFIMVIHEALVAKLIDK